MDRTLSVAIVILCVTVVVAVTIYMVSTNLKSQEWLCGYKDNVFVVIYKNIRPYEQTFKEIQSFITYIIQSNASDTLKLELSLCVVDFKQIPSNLKEQLDGYTIYPVFVVYSSKLDPQKTRILDLIFNRYGYTYFPKQDALVYIYLYLSSRYGYTYLDAKEIYPNVVTTKSPALDYNETTIIGSINAKYYLFIYEDAYCSFCAKMYQETIPKLLNLVENGTVAIVLKNMITHEEALEVHKNIVSLYLENKNGFQIFEIMNDIYAMVAQNSIPSLEKVKDLITRRIGRLPDLDRYGESAEKLINFETIEAYNLTIFGTPGIVIWNNEREIGIVIVGFRSYETILKAFELIS
ncbi:MAG: thioredoxin domain-containing protein [Ignisphaera sp.]|uniref:Thioredoxin-like fold domain-containing protein n=1 Tax=Ignisphaera aggregans TaxID=334771 RepID=A0A7J3MWN5_9CREN